MYPRPVPTSPSVHLQLKALFVFLFDGLLLQIYLIAHALLFLLLFYFGVISSLKGFILIWGYIALALVQAIIWMILIDRRRAAIRKEIQSTAVEAV